MSPPIDKRGQPSIFRDKQGVPRYLLLNADIFEMHGTKCMLTVGVDISEGMLKLAREQVPAAVYVHADFKDLPDDFGRFDAERIETGAELESIASGLALMARERDLTRWTAQA